jgi:GNAT superfamily N-acetyltransferase
MNIDFKVEKLRRDHVLEGFDCGREPLNRFLLRNALQSQQAGGSQTYVALATDRVIGYHTLVVGEVAPVAAPERIKKGLGSHPVPLMLLARLAVCEDWKGRGIGSALLKDALLRTLQAADIAGIRAFAVHAKDDEARDFYRHFDFVPSPSDPLHLFLILKDVRALLR